MTIELTETQTLVRDLLKTMPWETPDEDRTHVHVVQTTEEDDRGSSQRILMIYANGRLKRDPDAYCKSCGHRLQNASDGRFHQEFKWINGRYTAPGHSRRHNLTNRVSRLQEIVKMGHS